MNFDEQKLKRLDNIRLNDNQYENVIPINLKLKFKKGSLDCPFFLLDKICDIKLLICRKGIVENHLRIRASKKNLN